MPRGHNKKPLMSAAKWAARKIPKASHGKATPKPTTIQDYRPTQRLPLKRVEIAPEWAKLSKNDHAKVPGTRIQSLPGGVAVRVVLEDGKKFPPHKVLAVKKHLSKLAELKREKEEVSRMINSITPITSMDDPVESSLPELAPPACDVATPIEKVRASANAKHVGTVASNQPSKKARKEAAWRERQQKLAEQHAAKALEDGRKLASEQWCEGRVEHRVKGKAWVKVSDPSRIPDQVLGQLRATTVDIRVELAFPEGDFVPICYGDVSDRSLDLRPGVAVQFKVFTDKNGVGGCEAKAVSPGLESTSPKRSATEAMEADGKKRKKTNGEDSSKADAAAKMEQERVAAEGAAKAEQDRLAAEVAAKAEQERLAVEAAAKAEQDRLAAEMAAKSEQERLAAEAVAKAEQDRLAAEMAAKAEQERLAAEGAAKVEQDRVAAEVAAKAEQERLAAEAAAKAEQDRLAAEMAAKAQQERLAVEAAAKAEEDRLAAEMAAKAEQERLAAEAAAKVEQDRVAAEVAAKAKQERLAAEAAARAEQDRLAAEVAEKAERDRLAMETAEAATREDEGCSAAEAVTTAEKEESEQAPSAASAPSSPVSSSTKPPQAVEASPRRRLRTKTSCDLETSP